MCYSASVAIQLAQVFGQAPIFGHTDSSGDAECGGGAAGRGT